MSKLTLGVAFASILFLLPPSAGSHDPSSRNPNEGLAAQTSAAFDKAKALGISPENAVIPGESRKAANLLKDYKLYSQSAETQGRMAIAAAGGAAAAGSILGKADVIFPKVGILASGSLVLLGLTGLVLSFALNRYFKTWESRMGITTSLFVAALGGFSLIDPVQTGQTLFQILLYGGGVVALILAVTSIWDYFRARKALAKIN